MELKRVVDVKCSRAREWEGVEVRRVINHEKSYNRKKRTKQRRERVFQFVSGQWL